MFIIDSLIVGGLRFVLDKVAAAADQELNDPDRWRRELIALQMQLESGELDEQQFAARERVVLDHLRALGGSGVGVVAVAGEIASVEVDVEAGPDDDERDR